MTKDVEKKKVFTSELAEKRSDKIVGLLEQIDNSIIPDSSFNRIVSRALDSEQGSLVEFHVFDNDKIAKIAENMPAINRATRALGRRNTQTTNRLMSLTMLADASPYRAMRQCLSQIENKRNAVKENRYKIMRDRLEIEKLQRRIDRYEMRLVKLNGLIESEDLSKEKYEEYMEEIDDLSMKSLEYRVDIEEKAANLSDSMLYLEGALKEIASFQSSYEQIRKNNDIPEDWDERDMEEAEVQHHLRMAFLHAYRDVMAKSNLGMGTLEYLQQFGVHPTQALIEVRKFLQVLDKKMLKYDPLTGNATGPRDDIELDYEDDLEKWLDRMVENNKDQYKKVMKRIGLDNLHDDWYMYEEEGREKVRLIDKYNMEE